MFLLKSLLVLCTFFMFDIVFKEPELGFFLCLFLAAFLFLNQKTEATKSSYNKQKSLPKFNTNGLPMIGNFDSRGNSFGSNINDM